ncbi:MAG TPA: hypothetical protein VFR34_14255 [Paracoccaceae bacterium]|nr:hypothetical protein [Paracoccaceae bacterium]
MSSGLSCSVASGGNRPWIGSLGAIWTGAKQMMVTPKRIGIVITRRRAA